MTATFTQADLDKVGTAKWAIYMISSPNGKAYIGLTNDVETRWRAHRRTSTGEKGYAIHRAIRKYGRAMEWHVIAGCDSLVSAQQTEIECVRQHGTRAPGGYNLTGGGEGNRPRRKGRRILDGLDVDARPLARIKPRPRDSGIPATRWFMHYPRNARGEVWCDAENKRCVECGAVMGHVCGGCDA